VDFFAVAAYLEWRHCPKPPIRRMKPIDLPLEADRKFVKGPGGVSFEVAIDEGRVPCYVSRTALEMYFGADPGSRGRRCRRIAAGLRPARAADPPACRRAMAAPVPHRRPAVVLTVDAVFRALSWR